MPVFLTVIKHYLEIYKQRPQSTCRRRSRRSVCVFTFFCSVCISLSANRFWTHNHNSIHQIAYCKEISIRAVRCSAPAVWNSLLRSVLNRDSVAVSKSRLKTFLFFPVFLFFLCSLTCCLAPAPLKLRPYGTIQICSLLLYLIIICEMAGCN